MNGAGTTTPPSSRREYINLCKQHGDTTVKRSDSRKVHNCAVDTDHFITAALGGRTEVPLRDLIPWIRRHHRHWDRVMLVTDRVLIRIGALPEGFEYSRHGIERPKKERPKAF